MWNALFWDCCHLLSPHCLSHTEYITWRTQSKPQCTLEEGTQHWLCLWKSASYFYWHFWLPPLLLTSVSASLKCSVMIRSWKFASYFYWHFWSPPLLLTSITASLKCSVMICSWKFASYFYWHFWLPPLLLTSVSAFSLLSEFNNRLEAPEGNLIEIGKEHFVQLLKRKVIGHGQHTF